MDTCDGGNLILIPVHRPKMNWLVSFLNSAALYAISNQDKILLVISDKEELAYFSQALSYHPLAACIQFLDAEAYISTTFQSQQLVERLRQNANRSVINLKKMIGLHWALQRGIEYMVCLDCDVIAVDSMTRLLDVARNNYQEARYLGANVDGLPDSDLFRRILKESTDMFGPSEQQTIFAFTENLSVYTWFGDVPVYHREGLAAFFSYMSEVHGSLISFFAALRWATFDHMLFVLYRVTRGGARILNYRKELHIDVIPERLRPRELFQISTVFDYDVGWISATSAYAHPEAFRILPNLSLLMHFDR